MAREARKISSKGMYAVSLRGEKLFMDGEDKKVFLEMLEKYFAEGEVYGHDLEDSEIRLVVKEAPKGISMTMKPLIISYARYFNRTHNLDGKLFSDRFKSEPIESEAQKKEAIKALSEKGTLKLTPVKKIGDTKPKSIPKPEKEKEEQPVKRPVNRNVMPSYLL